MAEITQLTKSKDKSKIGFVLTDATPAYANALRRSIISLVPTLAIEDVELQENSSALYDETIAHRLGLLPLVTDLESYFLTDLAVAADGVSRAGSEVKLSLEAKGPATVLASELVSRDPKVKCAYPDMPIVKLLKGQSLKFEATAVMGQGITHMKWAPAAAHFQHLPIVKDGSKSIEVTPKDVLEEAQHEFFVKEDGSLSIPVTKAKNAQVSYSPNQFLFVVESFGQLKPEAILREAVSQLDKRVDAFAEIVKTVAK